MTPALERRLFLVLVALHLLLFVFLVADRRMPRGHDTRAAYTWFQNPQAGSQCPLGGPVPLALFPVPVLRDALHLPLFYAGLLVDELLLLVGSWLLARRYYPDPRVVFFVAAAAGGSALWADQAGHNFHSLALLPLAIALLHAFIDTGRGSRLFLAANLLALQTIGQPMAAPLTPFSVFVLYAVAFVSLRRPRLRYPGHLWLGGALLSWGMATWILLHTPTETWLKVDSGPWTELPPFTGGWDHPIRLADFLLGISPCLNYTLYCGLLTVGFAVLGLLRTDRSTLARAAFVLSAGLIAFSLLLAIQAALFPASPSASTTLMPFLKLAVIFASGRGLEIALRDRGAEKRLLPRVAAGMALLALLLVALSVIVEIHWIDGLGSVLTPASAPSPHLRSPTIRSGLLGTTALWAGLAAVTLAGLASARTFALAAVLVLVLQPLDVFGWKFRMTWLKTYPLSESAYASHRLDSHPLDFDGARFQARENTGRSPWILGIQRDSEPRETVSWHPRGPLTSLAGINAAAWVILALGAVGRLVVRPGKEAIP